MTSFSFELVATNGHARAGILRTPHGEVKTPIFMPVGTQGSVKSLSPDDVAGTGATILLGNTYHLYLRPGDEVVKTMGGLHQFMRWNGVILTDSGGYQVSSLGHFKRDGQQHLTKISEEGVLFKSHLDGSIHQLTPEKAVEIQEHLGSDILMAFDEATPDMGREYAQQSMERTHRWLVRCKKKWEEMEALKLPASAEGCGRAKQALFGIIQGGIYEDLRQTSAAFMIDQDLPGIALGGASIGQSAEETERCASWTRALLPPSKPIYFMGLGVKPSDIVAAVKSGADMFDCVAPTKLARTGMLYTGSLVGLDGTSIDQVRFESEDSNERIVIEKKQYETDHRPIDEHCDCYTCSHGFSRAYLRHLYRSKELLYYRLASIHNVRMMIRVSEQLRDFIIRTSH
jgi:queuine tRNA-ribosyltransferase